jgi:hypothetical protein
MADTILDLTARVNLEPLVAGMAQVGNGPCGPGTPIPAKFHPSRYRFFLP